MADYTECQSRLCCTHREDSLTNPNTIMDQDYIKKTTLKNEAYDDRSGCAKVAIVIVSVIAFWTIVGIISLFIK